MKSSDSDLIENLRNIITEKQNKKEENRKLLHEKGSMLTYSGKILNLFNIEPHDISIIDIAASLSKIPRFTGHCREFISVAQHSVMVSKKCNSEYALWGLLHDASEAYLNDLARPLKRTPELEGYRKIEKEIQKVICDRFNLSYKEHENVIKADLRSCATEIRFLFPSQSNYGFFDDITPYFDEIKPLDHKSAQISFLERYLELQGE